MNFTDKQHFRRWFIIAASIILTCLVVWNAVIFFQRLKEEERGKMNIWASAQISLAQAGDNTDLGLIFTIINNNSTIPVILVNDKREIVDAINIREKVKEDPQKLEAFLNKIKAENEPIEMDFGKGKIQRLYYGNSPLLNKLKYYPLVLYLIIILLIAIIYFFYTTTKSSEQNKLWAGMAKETAHQIGTPLSSLIGWTEILKQQKVNPDFIIEIEKDVNRLRTITERFSKIGSTPTLTKTDIVAQTEATYNYLKSRSSKLIDFNLSLPEEEIYVNLNEQLYSWTIENLVKNAIDAMRGKGYLGIKLKEDPNCVHIFIKDTGKGIPKSKFKRIFEPGFTTKKRGWGLGLSLSKRIIEQYHNGKIKVIKSELGKGTTFKITFQKT